MPEERDWTWRWAQVRQLIKRDSGAGRGWFWSRWAERRTAGLQGDDDCPGDVIEGHPWKGDLEGHRRASAHHAAEHELAAGVVRGGGHLLMLAGWHGVVMGLSRRGTLHWAAYRRGPPSLSYQEERQSQADDSRESPHGLHLRGRPLIPD